MNITCPNCDASFMVPKEQLGTIGRRVKCSKCLSTWYQLVDAPIDNQPQNIENNQQTLSTTNSNADLNKMTSNENPIYLSKGTNLPVLLPLNISHHSNIVPILLASISLLLLFILFHDKFNILPKFYNNNLLVIDNIQTAQNTNTKQIKISYRITNNYNYNITIPLTKIRLLDKKNVPVKSYILEQKDIKLSPKQYIEISTNLDSVPTLSDSLDIMLGNNLDFILQ
ncbi:MAG: zinc-ribbon domain-containing protein [Rickettsia endosymbiont of Bryobia graminum]|nr:zinc-ribbon domain-containing protein [Rickettsia endosymbiont of Bryobia graminum]